MRNIIQPCLFFLILSICISCGHPTSSRSKQLTFNLLPQQILRIDLDDAQAVYPRSSIFDTVRYIQLETKPECLIGSISKILYVDNKFIIMNGGGGGSRPILLFSNAGKFLNRIGDCGSGPGEYFRPDDIAYDPYNHELIIWSNDDRKILRYRLDGKFIDSFRLDFWISNIAAYDKALMMAYVNNAQQPAGYGNDYHFLFIDRKGTIIAKHDEYNSDSDIFRAVSYSPISTYNGNMIFNFPWTNGVFQIFQDSLVVKYCIDYGKNNIPSDFFVGKTAREARKEISDLNLGLVLHFSESDTHMYIRSNYNQCLLHTLFNKQTQRSISFGALINNDQELLYPAAIILTMVEDHLIGFCESNTFEMTKDIYSKLQSDTSGKHIKSLVLQKYQMGPEGEFKMQFLEAVKKMNFKYNLSDLQFVSGVNLDDNPLIFIGKIREDF